MYRVIRREIPHDILSRHPGQRLSGGGGGYVGTPGAPPLAQESQPNYVVAPPTIERPPNATDLFTSANLLAQTIATSPATYPNAFQVPENNVAVIRSVSLLVNNLLIDSDITWTLRFNGVGVGGWDALTVAPRAAGSLEVSFTPFETFIPVPEGALIDWVSRVVDAGTYQVSVTTHGWFYPVAIAAAASRAYGG